MRIRTAVREPIAHSLGPPLLAAALVLVVGCASTQRFTLGAMAGSQNVDAVEAAVACRVDEALSLAEDANADSQPTHQLFSHFLRAALLTEMGDTATASRLLDEATADPGMNPDGATSREEMQEAADGILEGIQEQRFEESGQRTCAPAEGNSEP